MTPQQIIDRVREVINDTAGNSYTNAAFIQWINDGMLYIATSKPDSVATTATFLCDAGVRQALTSAKLSSDVPMALLDVVRDDATGGPITAVDRETLDAHVPTWMTTTPAGVPRNYVYDPRQALVFYLYPAPAADRSITLTFQREPAAATTGALNATLALADMYRAPLLDYVLHRIYSSDTEDAQNLGRAAQHLAACNNVLGIRTQSQRNYGPSMNAAGDAPTKAAMNGGV